MVESRGAAPPRRQLAPDIAVGGIGLLAALLVLFFVWPSQQFVDTRRDPYNYAAIARQIRAEGFGAHGLTKREASLYPLSIAAVSSVFGERPDVVPLLQCLLFAATCMLVCDIGTRLYNRRTGLIAGLLIALNPLPLRYVADLHMETLLTCLVTLNVWTMVRFYERRTVGRGIAVGVVAGIAALTKGVAIVPPLVFGAVWVIADVAAAWRGRSRPAPWPAVAAIALATIVIIAPWTARNYRVTGGRFVLIAPGLSDAFLRGYVFSRPEYALLRRPPYIDAENECNVWLAAICRRAGAEFGRDEVRDEAILGAEARRLIVSSPGETVRKTAVGLLTFWYQMTTVATSAVAGLIALAAWLVAIPGWRRSRREGRPGWLVLMPIIAMNVFIAALCSLGRYSMPILPCLMILAAFGLDTLARPRRRESAGVRAPVA